MSNQSNEAKFFDLHTTGIGYLNRIRQVSPRKGKPFTCVTVAALHGATEKAEYSYIDCNVVGAEAESLVKRCQQAVEANKKVLVSFRIGDIWADAFTYEKGDKKGQAGASLKGRLLYIGWIKVDGKLVYEAKPKTINTPVDNHELPAPEQPLNQEPPVADQFGEQRQPNFGDDDPQQADQAA
ncbi:STY4534 family ICE replication protein [Pseudomonas sp. NyZ201]|uniref:STY4534 family ICE replication protein n=1 Tax=Pseudomonas sp. NyZ201 TaxID=3409857 RepID=UPI003CE94565